MQSSSPQERGLVDRYLQGETEASATVDRWIQQAARSYARRLQSQWEDVLQDVRLEVFRLLRRGDFRGEAQLKTYLWRVVSHTCLDKIRALERWRWTDLENPDLTAISEQRSAEQSAWNESRDLLRRVLAEVSEDCKKLWAMVVAGMSYREIGEKLAVSEGTLRVRAVRCRQKTLAIRARLLGENGSSVESV